MSPARLAYLALVIWGTVHPMYWFVTYMQETGTGLAGLIAAWSVNASTRGLTWDLTIAAIALMLAQPAIIKRPLLDDGNGHALLGFNADAYQQFITEVAV